MSQCFYCGKTCADHAVLCEACQEEAREQFQQGQAEQLDFAVGQVPFAPVELAPQGSGEALFFGASTAVSAPAPSASFASSAPSAPAFSVPPLLEQAASSPEKVVSRLSAAARAVAVESSEHRLKRASRLRPL